MASTATSGSFPWKEHILDEIPVTDGDVTDAVTCLLHTVLFTRAPGPVRPSEATCHAFPSVSYSLCAVGDVSRKVEQAARSFEESLVAGAAQEFDPYAVYPGSSAQPRGSFGGGTGGGGGGSSSGCLVVAFFERKLKKALFGLMSNEEKIYFEKWIVPVHVTPAPTSPEHHEAATRETERALQRALLHILSAVQTIDHVPISMYDFEITPYASLEAMQSGGGSTSYGLGLQGSTSMRMMGCAVFVALDHPVPTSDPAAMKQADVSAADISPPVVSSRLSPPARKCRPPFSARHTRASCISFAAASGRDVATPRAQPYATTRPLTARPASSHRRLTAGTTTQWQFLSRTTAEAHQPTVVLRPRSSRPTRPRPRPASARESHSTSTPMPTRPATNRAIRPRTAEPTKKKSAVVVDPRVLHEAARHETEQELYNGPLLGKSVEVQQPDLLTPTPFRDSCVANAVSLAGSHRMKAFQARAKGDQHRAILHYEKLLELEPIDQVALFQLAVAYEKTGRLADAQAAYNRVLPLEPANPFLHYNMGNLLVKMGHVEQAIAAYTTAIQSSGGAGRCPHLAFYRQRGAVYRKNGDFQKAAQDYARVHAVHHRRMSLSTATTDATVLATHPPQQARSKTASLGENIENADYSAEPIYSPRNFAWRHGESLEQQGSSLDDATHRRAMAIAATPAHARTEEDLWCLSDELQRHFPCCAALDPDARKKLSARVVAGSRLPRGAMLVQEGTSGGECMFLIARGRVSVYKQFAPHVVLSVNQKQEAETNAPAAENTAVSWEELRATVIDDPVHSSEEEKSEAFQSMATNLPTVNLASWTGDHEHRQVLLTQLKSGDVCGRQGRFSQQTRVYSAVVSEQCDFFAVSWADFREVERMHRESSSAQLVRFLSTVPLFHGIAQSELLDLARLAKHWKVVGERVICSEGQHVDGLILVREGQLCQLSPSGLRRPPNLSVTFSLSGSIAMNYADPEHGGFHLFTQLEHSDDPLLFLHDSGLMHGFLSRDYLPKMLAKLSEQHPDTTKAHEDRTHRVESEMVSLLPPAGATGLSRGAFFSASSSWIPPRKSRLEEHASAASGGVSCAKHTLVSTESSDLVFFTSEDLTTGLSLASRDKLHKNMQQITAQRSIGLNPAKSAPSHTGLSALRRLVFLKPPPGDDLVRQFLHDTNWQSYKQQLVTSIVEDAQAARKRQPPHHDHDHDSSGRCPATAWASWKR